MFFCLSAEETGREKNCLGECSFKVTHPDGECSKILVSNPVNNTICSVLLFYLVFKSCYMYILNGFIEPLIPICILIKFFLSVDTVSTHLENNTPHVGEYKVSEIKVCQSPHISPGSHP